MEIHQSHLQEDGTTFPRVTPDVPQPPGVAIPVVPDPFEELMPEDETGVEGGEGNTSGK